jgi:endonuclease-3 related protein
LERILALKGRSGLAGKGNRDRLLGIYEVLYGHFGPQHWWPGEDPFEVVVGAILAQNTSWKNVENAIANLKEARVLSPEGMAALGLEQLAELIRPSGTYRVKARRLLEFVSFLKGHYGLSLQAMFRVPLSRIRAEILSVKGIGPETADSILLYAGGYPVFVVDAYTKRIFSRHGFIRAGCAYGELQALFMKALPPDVSLFNEYHALIVRLGKNWCHARPICEDCVLRPLLHGKENLGR